VENLVPRSVSPPKPELPQKAREAIALAKVQQLAEQARGTDFDSSPPDESWKTIAGFLGMPVEFDAAPFGIVGLETELGLFIDLLVHRHKTIAMCRLIEMLTVNPAKLLGLEAGTLSLGAPADVTLIDPDLDWTVDAGSFQSASRNTPFHGWKLKGRAVRTIVAGKTVWQL